MKNLPPFPVLLFFALTLGIPAFPQQIKSYPYYIQWDAVEGAGGYIVEVQTLTGDLVFDEKIGAEKTDIEFLLPAGFYQVRITTLNKLSKPENSTDWAKIEILSQTAPVIKSIRPVKIVTDNPVVLTLQADRLAFNVKAFLHSPSGRQIPMNLQKMKNDSFQLTAPAQKERGAYTLSLTNPPNLTSRIKSALFIEYREPLVTGIAPETLQLQRDSETSESFVLQISGKNFSRDITLAFHSDSDASFSLIPSIEERTDKLLTVKLDRTIPPGEYTLYLSNAQDMRKKEGGLLIVLPIVEDPVQAVVTADTPVAEEMQAVQETPAVEETAVTDAPESKEVAGNVPIKKERPPKKRGRLSVGAGINRETPFGYWETLYTDAFYSGLLFSDFYLTKNTRPVKGQTFDFSVGVRSDFSAGTIFAASILLCPSLTVSSPYARVKYYFGAGVNYIGNGPQNKASPDPAFATGIALEFPVGDIRAIGISNQFFYIPDPNPLHKHSLSLYGLFFIPVKK